MTSKTEMIIGLLFVGLVVGLFLYYFIKSCFNVTVTPESCDPMNEENPFNEVENYLFKTPSGMIVREDDYPKLFEYKEAKDFAKNHPYYKLQIYGDIEWHSCSTYFL